MIKLFEEYRYINFADPRLLGIRHVNLSPTKDENEPFFNKPKKKYKDRLAEVRRMEAQDRRTARARMEERDRELRRQRALQQDLENRQRYEENLIRVKEEFLIIYEYIDIVKNYTEKIIKSKYDISQNKYGSFGVLLENKVRLTCHFDMSRNENGVFHMLKINGKQMTNELEKKENKEQDPFGEETWGSKIPPAETLARLIKDYIVENEIIF